MLGIAREVVERGGSPGTAEYFAAVLTEHEVVGCAFRMLFEKVGITRLGDSEALAAPSGA